MTTGTLTPTPEGMLYAVEHSDDDYRCARMIPNPDANPFEPLTTYIPEWGDITEAEYWKLREDNSYALAYHETAAGFDFFSYHLNAQIMRWQDDADSRLLADIAATQADMVGQEGVG
jgi:hypothetical protein